MTTHFFSDLFNLFSIFSVTNTNFSMLASLVFPLLLLSSVITAAPTKPAVGGGKIVIGYKAVEKVIPCHSFGLILGLLTTFAI